MSNDRIRCRTALPPRALRRGLWFTVLGLGAAAAAAEGSDRAADAPVRHERTRALVELETAAAHLGAEALQRAAGALAPARVVKGAPYCADAVHEEIQWLPDAAGGPPNRIVQQRATRLCRDGEGRTRQEVRRGDRQLVYLNDPVARESWVLDPARKTARSTGLAGAMGSVGAAATGPEGWREWSQRMQVWAREMSENFRKGEGARLAAPTPPTPPVAPVPPVPPVPPAAGLTPAVVTLDGSGPSSGPGRVEVRVLRLDGGAIELPPMPSAGPLRFTPRGPGSVTPLPSRELDGLRVHGERTTWTIEAGRIGNERPIVITREVWSSPELMLTVSSHDVDPRSGEVRYRLENLRRGEPDPALMKVPADYDARPGTRRGEKRERPAERP